MKQQRGYAMLTRTEALAVVARVIADINSGKDADNQVVICEEHTVERDHVIAFSYQTKRYVETGNSRHALYGNGPIIVNRRTGAVAVCGTNRSRLENIDDYERRAAAGDW
jgi:hypothetical protein